MSTEALHSPSAAPRPAATPSIRAAVLQHLAELLPRGLHGHERVRLYTWSAAEALDDAFWRRRLETAIDLRRELDSRIPAAAEPSRSRLNAGLTFDTLVPGRANQMARTAAMISCVIWSFNWSLTWLKVGTGLVRFRVVRTSMACSEPGR